MVTLSHGESIKNDKTSADCIGCSCRNKHDIDKVAVVVKVMWWWIWWW